MRHKDLFPEVQIHQSESYVSVEELVGLESLATRSLELGLFSTTPPFHYLDPFHQEGKITPAQTCRCSPHCQELAGDAYPSRRLTSKSNKCKLRSLTELRVLKLCLLSAARN